MFYTLSSSHSHSTTSLTEGSKGRSFQIMLNHVNARLIGHAMELSYWVLGLILVIMFYLDSLLTWNTMDLVLFPNKFISLRMGPVLLSTINLNSQAGLVMIAYYKFGGITN